MRRKHWQGYGCVDVKVKENSLDTSTGISTVTIKVSGNHEYGLNCGKYDNYQVAEWLGKIGKFTHDTILKYEIVENGFKRNEEKNIDEEYCIYKIFFKNSFYNK